MARIEWENGTLVKQATVEVGGVEYNVNEAEYTGNTPLSAENLNAMQNDIYNEIKNVDDKIGIGNNFNKINLTRKTSNLGTNSWVDMATAKSVSLKSGTYMIFCNFTTGGTTSSANGLVTVRITINGSEKGFPRQTVPISGTLISSGTIATSFVLESDANVSFNCQSYANVTTKVNYDPEFLIVKLI